MQETELQGLLKQTAIELDPDQIPVFLEYFSGMKEMFDAFCEDISSMMADSSAAPATEHFDEAGIAPEKCLVWFTNVEEFTNREGILANVDAKRLIGDAIEVKSALGE